MKVAWILCAVTLLAACDAKQDRYKIVTQGVLILKIDTQTGEPWRWVADSDPYSKGGGEWKRVGTPP